jgi:hypothetical protein
MAETSTLHDAFIDELRDRYDAERQLTKARGGRRERWSEGCVEPESGTPPLKGSVDEGDI